MRNLSWVVLGLLLCVPFAGAEVIDSVSFNPARLGRYETLKVSDQLTTKGGIEANAVTVQSGGTVSVNNAGNYKFPVTEVLGSVDMKSTDFKAVTLNSRGTASFENKSGSAESKISTLNTSTADVRANILDLTNVTVPDEDENSLRLGENDIPRPASVGLDNCSNLRWVERTTDDNYKYKVLAFGTCKGGETEPGTAECTDGEQYTSTKLEDLCNGICGNKVYLCRNGQWNAVGCSLRSDKECFPGYPNETKCTTQYGVTICKEYTCNDLCEWVEVTKDEKTYKWSTEGLNYFKGNLAIPSGGVWNTGGTSLVTSTTDINVCLKYFPNTFPGTAPQSVAGKTCNASLLHHVYASSCQLNCTYQGNTTNGTCTISWVGARCVYE